MTKQRSLEHLFFFFYRAAIGTLYTVLQSPARRLQRADSKRFAKINQMATSVGKKDFRVSEVGETVDNMRYAGLRKATILATGCNGIKVQVVLRK